jgi:ribosomal protein S18 acetylase RimI-like enzyme
MHRYLQKPIISTVLFLLGFTLLSATPCQQNQSPQKLHEWAIQSHREFWTLLGQMAGYEARNESGYQYVRSKKDYGLNYIYIAKDYANPDFVINMMKDRAFTIFFDADNENHMFKYITILKEGDDFITMGMDLKKLQPTYSFKPGVKVWKVTTDAEFDQWITVTASRRTPNDTATLKEYFSNFKPSKNNPAISFYLGSINGNVVGTSLIYFSSDFASLYWVGVHPDHRRHGLGSALSYVPLQEAINKGYRWSVLQAQPLGVPVYPKLGFEKVGLMKVFYYMPARY